MTAHSFTYGSVCSGIEAATVAWHPLGWKPAFFSEIDKFPRALLQFHYPDVPLHGDFTSIGADDYGSIDLLVGGTPCQSFSIAGLRGGMDDERGNLTLEYLKLVDRKRPRWLVWENVPGVLSSKKGRDFGAFIGGLGELGYGWAYRVLDAQYFGVAQRRRRVFVVGYLGDPRLARAVLFERQSLQGHPAPRRQTREGAARDFEVGPSGNNRAGVCPTLDARCKDGPVRNQVGVAIVEDVAGTLQHGKKSAGSATSQDAESGLLFVEAKETLAVQPYTNSGYGDFVEGVGPLRSNGGDIGLGSETICVHGTQDPDINLDLAHTLGRNGGQENVIAFSCKDSGDDCSVDISPTLRSMNSVNSNQNAGGQVAVCITGDVTHALTSEGYDASEDGSGRGTPLTVTLRGRDGVSVAEVGGEVANALRASQGGGDKAYVMAQRVRRLTPRECERLQGFPDDYTLIPYRGKASADCPDGPRYRALGNSMAVPVMAWIGERIQAVETILKQQSEAVA